MKSLFKKLDVSGHFKDFKHHAISYRNNKKIRSRKERRMLNEVQEFAKKFTSDAVHETAKMFRRKGW